MDNARFGQLKQRGAMLAIADHLYKRGLVTKEEHCKLMLEIRKNYYPEAGSLSAAAPLETIKTEGHSEKGGF